MLISVNYRSNYYTQSIYVLKSKFHVGEPIIVIKNNDGRCVAFNNKSSQIKPFIKLKNH